RNLLVFGRHTSEQARCVEMVSSFTCKCLVALALLLSGTTIGHAEEWPAHPVKVVVPYGPGGIADVFGRMTADRLSKALGTPFVVESRGGAGGAIGTEYVVRSPPD